MGNAGEFTQAEILSQPKVWAETLDTLDLREPVEYYRRAQFDSVLFTGCGSTYYLSLAASTIFQNLTGVTSRGLPASEVWLYPGSAYTDKKRHLLIAVSRSGETSETLRAVEAHIEHDRGPVMTFTCYPESPLALLGDVNVVLPASQEQSIVQTRSFSSLFLAITALAAAIARRDDLTAQMAQLPEICDRLLARYAPVAHNLAVDSHLDRFYFLGSGSRYGLASELSLKMKEMSLSHSEPFHFLEFRHGPMSMAEESSLIVGLVSERTAEQETAVIAEMQARDATIFTLGEADTSLEFGSGLDNIIRDVLYLPIGQLLAYEHSLSKGLNPDQPHNLTAVVRLS